MNIHILKTIQLLMSACSTRTSGDKSMNVHIIKTIQLLMTGGSTQTSGGKSLALNTVRSDHHSNDT